MSRTRAIISLGIKADADLDARELLPILEALRDATETIDALDKEWAVLFDFKISVTSRKAMDRDFKKRGVSVIELGESNPKAGDGNCLENS